MYVCMCKASNSSSQGFMEQLMALEVELFGVNSVKLSDFDFDDD